MTAPLRVLVVGSSISYMVSPRRSSRADLSYGEHLPALLAEQGVAASVRWHSQWFGLVHEARRRYEFFMRSEQPDVVIVNFGMGEAQARVLPTWVVRHFTTWATGSTGWSVRYRSRVAPALWRPLRRWQQVAHPRVGSRTHRLSPKRFSRELAALVRQFRSDCGSLVLVVDLNPVGSRVEHWMPGLGARAECYNELVAAVVSGADDPEVRLVRMSEVPLAHGVDAVLPDGFHLTAPAHREFAKVLAAEIGAWARDRG